MPGIEDWLNCPLQIIQSLFVDTQENHSQNVKTYFESRITEKNAKFWIPSLNDVPLHELQNGSLARFRCMVQDMHDTEFYMSAYEVKDQKSGNTRLKCGKFSDIAKCGKNEELIMDSPRTAMSDRQTLYCIPVPGENQWVKQAFNSQSKYKPPSTVSSQGGSKRSLEAETESMETEAMIGSGEPELDSKRSRTEPTTESSSVETSSVETPGLNFPFPDETGPACLIKMYDESDNFKVNDVLDVIGVLSIEPTMALTGEKRNEQSSLLGPESEGMDMDAAEEQAHCPPPSLVPRMHAILVQKMAHENPLIPSNITLPDNQADDFLKEASCVREEMLAVLRQAVLGDSFTAELLLCHLLSTVYARQDVVAVGKFSLNISKVPEKLSMHLYSLIQQLVTKSHFFSMKLDNLNGTKMLPHKDYTANRLSTGRLQISHHTHLVLDETKMQAGQLDVTGVRNLRALGDVITWQKVEYDFNYHKQDFHCDIPVLVLSEGKSLLTCDSHVPLSLSGSLPDVDEQYKGIEAYLTPALLTKLRMYLTLTSMLPYSLPEDLQKDIEQDFVDKRKEDTKNMTIENFQCLLVLARLLSLSHGHSVLKKEVWERAKIIDNVRKQRVLDARPAASS